MAHARPCRRSSQRLRLTAALCALALVAGCGSARAQAEVVHSDLPRQVADGAAVAPAAAALDRFGGELFAAVSATSKGNLIVSPYSVAAALAMTRAGAQGATRAQFDRVLHVEDLDADAGYNAIDQALSTRSTMVKLADGKTSEVTLATANALWPQKDYPFNPAFLDLLATMYGAGLHVVDFQGELESARRSINRWVADRTAKKIPELITKGVLDSQTRLVLTNAIYFKASWAEPFDERATADATFNRLDTSTVTAAFMHLGTDLRYAAGSGWQAIELPYAGEKLAMAVIVPDSGRYAEVESALRAGSASFLSHFERRNIDLSMPKFKFRTQADLVDVLRGLGLNDLFDPSTADLSAMTDAEKLYVSAVLHEAFIDVNEKGTEAAAATAVAVRASAAPAAPLRLALDRPFFVVLRDLETKTVLFTGRVLDPTA